MLINVNICCIICYYLYMLIYYYLCFGAKYKLKGNTTGLESIFDTSREYIKNKADYQPICHLDSYMIDNQLYLLPC